MTVREAEKRDIPRLIDLLEAVHYTHHLLRPDIFTEKGRKYSEPDLIKILGDENKRVFVCEADGDVVGYAFCVIKRLIDPMVYPMTEFYVDEICVDESMRRGGVATALFERIRAEAERIEADRITLNVWEGNEPARRFYEKMGMTVMKTMMEINLRK